MLHRLSRKPLTFAPASRNSCQVFPVNRSSQYVGPLIGAPAEFLSWPERTRYHGTYLRLSPLTDRPDSSIKIRLDAYSAFVPTMGDAIALKVETPSDWKIAKDR